MLKIAGDSMIEAGILDGDLVVVRQQTSANNGEIVVAMTEEKRSNSKNVSIKKRNTSACSQKNSSLQPIILQHVSIIGKVIGVYRNIH
ncbi:hypothetical protein GCM10020331_049650 [Ectobacillus funiculus]